MDKEQKPASEKKPKLSRRTRLYQTEEPAAAEGPSIEETGPNEGPQSSSPETAADECRRIIRKSVLIASGIGLVPIPLVDLVALTAFQARMINQLCGAFGYEYEGVQTKSLVISLVSSIGAVNFGSRLVFSVVKFIPGIGGILGSASTAISSGASTYAVGQVFLRHFSEGGTLLNFNPKHHKEAYRKNLATGERIARGLKG